MCGERGYERKRNGSAPQTGFALAEGAHQCGSRREERRGGMSMQETNLELLTSCNFDQALQLKLDTSSMYAKLFLTSKANIYIWLS